MNPQLLTGDHTKKHASNQSFWLIGQHDVGLEPIPDGGREASFRVSARGSSYSNTKAGSVESGGADRIAL